MKGEHDDRSVVVTRIKVTGWVDASDLGPGAIRDGDITHAGYVEITGSLRIDDLEEVEITVESPREEVPKPDQPIRRSVMRHTKILRTVTVELPAEARPGELWSECGKRITNSARALVHAATCCSVGRVR